MDQLDAYIPVHPKDIPTLGRCLSSVMRYVRPKVGTITIIAKTLSPELEGILKSHRALFLSEDEVVRDLKRADIPEIRVREIYLSGWYYQQFIKLGIAEITNVDYFLIIDADTVFLRPIQLLSGNAVRFVRGKQFHEPYFRTHERLFGYKPDRQASYMSNYMLYRTAFVRELLHEIEQRSGKRWHQAILQTLDTEGKFSFAEQEAYAYYVSRKHPETIESAPDSYLDASIRFYPLHPILSQLLRFKYSSITYHNYKR